MEEDNEKKPNNKSEEHDPLGLAEMGLEVDPYNLGF
jgi:hypothetical protein